MSRLTDSGQALLEVLNDPFLPYARPPRSPARDQLKRLGYIESYRPRLKSFSGHGLYWRITDLGRSALAQSEEKK